MAMAPERRRPLHNFNMPCSKWGNQKFLKCMKLNSNGKIPTVDGVHLLRSSASEAESEGFIGRRRESNSTDRRFSKSSEGFKKLLLSPMGAYDGIAEVKAKLMSKLRTAANMINVAISEEGEEDESAAVVRPWN
ncbi:hypothetical protein NE237_009544 [Protea cynaroides]|uniref:Uncharacterized protein n=1 Tax=Protea cynaroides TaxID=273540 RepID=A0A9Q0R0R2_9MAGN|nr:hypothetical protein NE237_009544 [Protea cynaroides]